jgi:hypothetical protein
MSGKEAEAKASIDVTSADLISLAIASIFRFILRSWNFFLLCNQNLMYKNEFTRPNSALFITACMVEDCYDYGLMAQGNHNILLIKL